MINKDYLNKIWAKKLNELIDDDLKYFKIRTGDDLMKDKRWQKIFKYLDRDNYHLFQEIDFNTLEPTCNWKLYSKHEGWFTDGSKAIMTSENNSLDDLLAFVKKHRKIDVLAIYNRCVQIIAIINTILCILNMALIHSHELTCMTFYGILYILLTCIPVMVAYAKKCDIEFDNQCVRLKSFIHNNFESEEDDEDE